MKKIRILALALCLIMVLAPVSVFADDETPKYNMDPTHLTFTSQEDIDAIVYRQDGKASSKETEYGFVDGELKLTVKDKGSSTGNPALADPMLFITVSNLATSVQAQDYPYIAVIYRMPKEANSTTSNALQLFCCTDGAMPAGDTVQPISATTVDGKYHYTLLNPGLFNDETANPGTFKKWEGTITSFRLDYFSGIPYGVENGDTIYIREIILFADEDTAKAEANAICLDLNLPDELTLQFNVGDYGTAPETQIVKKGELPVQPEDPISDQMIFDGWYTSKTYNTPFDFTKPLTKEKTIVYAKWASGLHVSFVCGEGTQNVPANQVVKKNTRATEPEAPTLEGYVFDGWYTDAEYTAEYKFSALVKEDVTLYAKWTKALSLTVNNGTAKIDGEEIDLPATVKAGDVITVTAAEPEEGKLFDGWTASVEIDADLSAAEITLTMPEQDVELTANYKDAVVITPADVNGDGKLNNRDVILIMKAVLAATSGAEMPAGFIEAAADMDGNGKLNNRDVVAVMKAVLAAASAPAA